MAEQCRLCGATVRVADAAHVMLNAPDAGVEDCYVCPGCFDDRVGPLFAGEEGNPTDGDEGDRDASDDGAPEDTPSAAEGDPATPE